MAETVLESGSTPHDRCLEHETCNKFIDDMVSYAMEYHDVENPPFVSSRPSGFDDAIGKALLNLMRPRNNRCVGAKTRRIVARCQRASFQEVGITIRGFLSDYRDFLDTSNPFEYLRFFWVLCSLCVKFSLAGRPDCVVFSTIYGKEMIADRPNHKGVLDMLHFVSPVLHADM